MKQFVWVLPLFIMGCSGQHLTESAKKPKPGEADSGDSKPFEVYNIPPSTMNLDIGKGFNSLSGMAGSTETANCVKKDTVAPIAGGGAYTKISLQSVTSNQDLYSKTGIDFALKVGFTNSAQKAADLVTGEASANLNQLSEKRLVSNLSYAVITAEKVFQPYNLQNPVMDPETIAFYNAHPELFFPNCGDSFVSSVMLGAKVVGFIQCTADSLETKQNLDAAISAKAGTMGLDASGSLSTSLQEIKKMSSNGCQAFVESMGGAGEINTTIDNFAQSIVNFVNNATPETSVAIQVGTLPYRTIQNSAVTEMLAKVKHDVTMARSYMDFNRNNFSFLLGRIKTIEDYFMFARNISEADKKAYEAKRAQLAADAVVAARKMAECAKAPFQGTNCGAGTSWGEWEQ